MVKRNVHFEKFQAGYLFPEITKRIEAFQKAHPEAKLISLGIGDTTQPLIPPVVKGLMEGASALGTKQGYTGYGPPAGDPVLRKKIASKLYRDRIQPHEIFLCDGAKSEIARLQMFFGKEVSIAVQDPTYPVYVDTSVAVGQTGFKQNGHYEGISYMPCLPENAFFPKLETLPRTDLIYFCSPNNPTGAVSTHKQLKALVDFAKKNRSIIIFDSAYAAFVEDPDLPCSIYEIEGAKEVAIEVGSFSKMAGFTGVRLGWSIVPEELTFDEGTNVLADWNRMSSTFFNGPCNIAEKGGRAVIDAFPEVQQALNYYRENAKILKEALVGLGLPLWGGEHIPYIWVEYPGKTSWEAFDALLEEKHLITTPGSGFGPAGEGFVRFSAFGNREEILEATHRLLKFSQYK